MSYNKLFVKDGLQYSHWVRHSVMKHVDDMVFQNRKVMGVGENETS